MSEYWISKVRRAQSSLSIFAQKYLHKCEDPYFFLQNKYICIDEDSFGAKILRDDCIQSTSSSTTILKYFQILEKFISMSAMTSIAISLAFMVTWHFHRKPETTIGPKITITHERESPLHKPTVQKCWLVRVE